MIARIPLLIAIACNAALPALVYADSGCPNLTGTFSCPNGTTTISQSESNGVTTYNFNGTQVTADGAVSPTGNNSDMPGFESYTCSQGALVHMLSMMPPETGQPIPVYTDTSYTLDQGNLTITSSLHSPGGSSNQGTQTCQMN